MATSNTAKQERRDAAREQARKMREAQQRREKRNRLLIIGGVVAFVAIVAIALVSILSQGGQTTLDAVDERPATATEVGGIPVGEAGAAGTENEGAPTVDVYYDFQCPHCATFEQTNGEDLIELATSGEATIVYHPISILDNSGNGTGFSTRAAQAVAVVADQAPELFPEFNAALFAAQGPTGGTPLSDEQIAQIATEVGVPEEIVDSIGGDVFRDWVEGVTAQAGSDGVVSTPTALINGEPFTTWQQPGALTEAVTAASGGAADEPTAEATEEASP